MELNPSLYVWYLTTFLCTEVPSGNQGGQGKQKLVLDSGVDSLVDLPTEGTLVSYSEVSNGGRSPLP